MTNPSSHLQTLIAHYLAQNYPSVLPSFLSASHTAPPDLAQPPEPDLRTLVEDYISEQLVKDLGDVDIDEDMEPAMDGSWRGWTTKDIVKSSLPPEVTLQGVRRSIEGISAMNLLTVGEGKIPRRVFDTSTASYRASYTSSIITTSVDKTVRFTDYKTGEVDGIIEPHKAAVLSFALHPQNPRYLLTGSMDGTTVLTDLITSQPLQTFKSTKFVVRVAFSPDGRFMATSSYDHNIVIYEANGSAVPPPLDEDDMPLDDKDDLLLAAEPNLRYSEVHRVKVDSNPEAILFHPESTWLMYTLRSSHLLYYVRLPSLDHHRLWEAKTKSFNPHPMDNHVSFSILNMALHPSNKIIACQTGDHRGNTGERILLYGVEPEDTERLAVLWTGSEGDDFVLPRMSWLPDGSGLITTTPNGYLNLISLSGENRSSVKIHGAVNLGQASSEVVRDCTVVSTEDGDWEAVSVGYDRQVRISR
ncbi:hypothetical protein I302_108354 [Kwoniella bestiolae CBS 10118]|uniref:Uncharacterized protein n=1 Tax=Kwoniella bestiolae CBS 10118 TaxID=1296100 RepID=A0A1B9FVY2_9TREE|nr:hypothetical protein I302_07273 [Kwoniella bestiolae CBS 10118]OCF22923.1 hypothetical protein I302_07273 [Kwoniella bestiolae CBS 10118]